MRNVVPGFETAQMGMPKPMAAPAATQNSVNGGFAAYHGGGGMGGGGGGGGMPFGGFMRGPPMPARPAANATRPGKNPGVAPNGFGVL